MKIYTLPVGAIGTNCYIYAADSGECMIIDPGAQPEKIAKYIIEHNLIPVKILITHGHYDHIGGVKKLLSIFENLVVAIGENDEEMLTDTSKSLASIRNSSQNEFIIHGAEKLRDGDVIIWSGEDITVMETPGHTKGGVIYISGGVIFSGDTLFRDDIGRCDLAGGDYNVMKQSLAKIADLPGDYTVYPGHGESTTLNYERKYNVYINGKV